MERSSLHLSVSERSSLHLCLVSCRCGILPGPCRRWCLICLVARFCGWVSIQTMYTMADHEEKEKEEEEEEEEEEDTPLVGLSAFCDSIKITTVFIYSALTHEYLFEHALTLCR